MTQDLYFEIDTETRDNKNHETWFTTLNHRFQTQNDAISFLFEKLHVEYSSCVGFFKMFPEKYMARYYNIVRVEKRYI